MILGLPDAWRITPTLDGALIDTEYGRVCHVARAPMMSARQLVQSRIALTPGYELASLHRTTTDEGELAVIACARNTDDVTREVVWGIVYADESLAYYELATDRAAAREVIATCARRHCFALGMRWRRYHYALPTGWDPITRGLVTDWYAPGFPRSYGVLTVYPAFPTSNVTIGIVPSLVANAQTQGLVIANERAFTPESTYHLEGVGAVVEGTLGAQSVRLQIAAFLDDRYVYAVELQSRSAAAWSTHQAALVHVVHSIEPIPRPR